MDMTSDRPIFLQIVDMVENEIISGNLKTEDQAPSTNEFSKMYNINPATARKGLTILVDEGVLYKKRGLGMFVTEKAREIIIEKRQREFLDNLVPELIREAKRLDIDKDKLIELIKQMEVEN
ncbi:GntR family transcriptional regulator [Miniphocaeibacter halophilus]|uniref:GntR family transcriptional regulator n=1 Tax=Miniphocaeibacter halophilus TaxID=2931922 RepID=A0AC61MWL4_9FIRM|nr:GntR family transcriptional regulator [Miniphocaeibacter halophilus]QQK08236.1 GntR family transcriptional regulator [Miniphocaeibacter halophilus]